MAKLTLSLGSNVGDRDQFLKLAREALSAHLGPAVFTSDIITTSPWGVTKQSEFRNQLLVVELGEPVTGKSLPDRLHDILDVTQGIEKMLGRRRDLHWGPRTLDIDLIFLDDLIYEDERVSLPHPWWHQRPFVRQLLPAGLIDPYGRILNPG